MRFFHHLLQLVRLEHREVNGGDNDLVRMQQLYLFIVQGRGFNDDVRLENILLVIYDLGAGFGIIGIIKVRAVPGFVLHNDVVAVIGENAHGIRC